MGYGPLTLTLAAATMLGAATTGVAQVPVRTPEAVSIFYNGMTQMIGASASDLGKLELDMSECFLWHSNSGINLPNDFRNMACDADDRDHNAQTLTSNMYVYKLSDYVGKQRVINPRTEIVYSANAGSLPTLDQQKKMATDNSVMTVVRKRYDVVNPGGTTSHEFVDTVYTMPDITGRVTIYSLVNHDGKSQTDDPSSLKSRAARAYSAGNYMEAYTLLERITRLNAKDSESYFRMAVMKFYGAKGSKSETVKRNRDQARDLMRKAYYNGSYSDEWARKAGQILEYWTHRGSTF